MGSRRRTSNNQPGEIHTIIQSESEYEERVRSLETDLAVFKRACFGAEDEKRVLLHDIKALKERLEALEAQQRVRRLQLRWYSLLSSLHRRSERGVKNSLPD